MNQSKHKGTGKKYKDVILMLKLYRPEIKNKQRGIIGEIAYQCKCSPAYVTMIKNRKRPGIPKPTLIGANE